MENSPLIRISRHTYVPTQPNQYVLAREIHRAKTLEIISHTKTPSTYVTGISANILRGYDTYGTTKDIHLHASQQKRGSRKHGAKYSTETSHTVKYHNYPLPTNAFETIKGIPTVTIPALIIIHLLENNPYQAIANAEAVIRGHLKPDIRVAQTSRQQYENLIKTVEKLLYDCNFRAKRRVKERLLLLSPWSESIGESAAKVSLLLAGLPKPQQQVTLRLSTQDARLDFYYPEANLAVEFDGKIKYENAHVKTLYAEKRREDELRQLIRHFVRFSWSDVHNLATVMQLRRLFPYSSLTRPKRQL